MPKTAVITRNIPFFLTRYSYEKKPGYTETMPSLTSQDHREETEIYSLLSRYAETGTFAVDYATGRVTREAIFGDFSDITSYADAQIQITDALQKFNQLPAITREKFDNRPENFLDYMNNLPNDCDEITYAELVSAGILTHRDDMVVKRTKAASTQLSKDNTESTTTNDAG